MGRTARSRRSPRQHPPMVHLRTYQPDGHGIGMIRTIAPLNDPDDHPILQMPSRSPAMVRDQDHSKWSLTSLTPRYARE